MFFQDEHKVPMAEIVERFGTNLETVSEHVLAGLNQYTHLPVFMFLFSNSLWTFNCNCMYFRD